MLSSPPFLLPRPKLPSYRWTCNQAAPPLPKFYPNSTFLVPHPRLAQRYQRARRYPPSPHFLWSSDRGARRLAPTLPFYTSNQYTSPGSSLFPPLQKLCPYKPPRIRTLFIRHGQLPCNYEIMRTVSRLACKGAMLVDRLLAVRWARVNESVPGTRPPCSTVYSS